MSNIVVFNEKSREKGPHWSGPAVCLACENEWTAVAPTGVHHIDCPRCKLTRGVPKYNFGTQEGEMVFVCHCKAELFFFRMHKTKGVQILCLGCGEEKLVESIWP